MKPLEVQTEVPMILMEAPLVFCPMVAALSVV